MLNRAGIAARVLHGGRAAMLGFPVAAVMGAIPGVILLLAAQGPMALRVAAMVFAALLMAGGSIVGAFAAAAISLARACCRHRRSGWCEAMRRPPTPAGNRC